jgi:hypothetical protein
MHFQFTEEGLMANPHFLTLSEPPKYPKKDVWIKKWFSLRKIIYRNGVDIQKVDEILRNHHKKLEPIPEWIEAKERMKDIRKSITLKMKPSAEKFFPKEFWE